jgi:hypothetical protein
MYQGSDRSIACDDNAVASLQDGVLRASNVVIICYRAVRSLPSLVRTYQELRVASFPRLRGAGFSFFC